MRGKRAAGSWIALPLTLFFVLIGWVMFRATTVTEGFEVYAGMFGANGLTGDPALWMDVTRESVALALVAAVVVFLEPHIHDYFSRPVKNAPVSHDGTVIVEGHAAQGALMQAVSVVAVLAIGVLTVLKLAEQSFSPFLYFQF